MKIYLNAKIIYEKKDSQKAYLIILMMLNTIFCKHDQRISTPLWVLIFQSIAIHVVDWLGFKLSFIWKNIYFFIRGLKSLKHFLLLIIII